MAESVPDPAPADAVPAEVKPQFEPRVSIDDISTALGTGAITDGVLAADLVADQAGMAEELKRVRAQLDDTIAALVTARASASLADGRRLDFLESQYVLQAAREQVLTLRYDNGIDLRLALDRVRPLP